MNDADGADPIVRFWASLLTECGGVVGLAQVLDVDRSTVTRWIGGKNAPDPVSLERLRELSHLCNMCAPGALFVPRPRSGQGGQGRPTTLPPLWAALAAAWGGVAGLAEALEISEATLWRWAHGKRQIRAAQREAIIEAAGMCDLESPV